MQCRHTVPDWHRYVKPAGDAIPIFAGCHLLVKEGEPAADPRSIACAYWGHQRDCPLYDGPGAATTKKAAGSPRTRSEEMPVEPRAVWPVRPPGTKDGMRIVLIVLGVVSTGLLVWSGFVSLAILIGGGWPAGYLQVSVVAAVVSILTHILATLRTWARR